MKTVAIVQARMGSTRLPGKVLHDIAGKPMLARVVERINCAESIDDVVIATTREEHDEPIVDEAKRLEVSVFQGSEHDVLDRYYWAAVEHEAEIVVRITSDCPLIDPQVIDQVIDRLITSDADYASNFFGRTFPRGLDTEALTSGTLQTTWCEATEDYEREHVTPYVYENPDRFFIVGLTADSDHSYHRWTVDTPDDLEFVRAVYRELDDDIAIGWRDLVKFLEEQPAIYMLNQHVMQKSLKDG